MTCTMTCHYMTFWLYRSVLQTMSCVRAGGGARGRFSGAEG
jgi:hypothetical protein